jgi:hypothetical protein
VSNPVRYIKDLEAAGFARGQAEAQVQMVFDAIEGDLVTKSDFAIFKEHIDRKFGEIDHRFNVFELRIVVKLGLITVSSMTVAVALLTWLIKIQ